MTWEQHKKTLRLKSKKDEIIIDYLDNAVEIRAKLHIKKLIVRPKPKFYEVVEEAHKQGYRLELVKKEIE